MSEARSLAIATIVSAAGLALIGLGFPVRGTPVGRVLIVAGILVFVLALVLIFKRRKGLTERSGRSSFVSGDVNNSEFEGNTSTAETFFDGSVTDSKVRGNRHIEAREEVKNDGES